MQLFNINTGFFKLDGGAMFGVVPKSIWSRTNLADENNLCTWAMRCLLIENNGKLILIDNGIGNKQPDSFFKYFYLHGKDSLVKSINAAGFSLGDVSDNILTHLHFDHCGGGTVYNSSKDDIVPLFNNAIYWVHSHHWQWATQPNAREKASFLTENLLPLQKHDRINFIETNETKFDAMKFLYVDGHTDKQTIPHIKYKNHTIVFAADLLPSIGHIPLPYVMGYDTRPLITMTEKEKFLQEAADNNYIIFLQHDPVNECCTVQKTDKGVRLKETFRLADI